MLDLANETGEIDLGMGDLRAVAQYAAASAQEVLRIFEHARPGDSRPRDAAWPFARGGARPKALRDAAWAAMRAARKADTPAAGDAARAVMCAPSSAYLHPLARSHQVKLILSAVT